MKSSNRFQVAITVLLTATLACNVSINAPVVEQPNLAFTAAAQTVAAVQASLVPLSSPTSAAPPPVAPNTIPAPTLAPLPTSTFLPTATQQCDKAAFVTDMSIVDGTILGPGVEFDKIWRLKNIGTCSWTPSYKVVYFSGPGMADHAQQPLGVNVAPGQTVDITVRMTSPAENGNYTEYWKLRNESGVNFSQFYVQISVQGGGGDTVVALNNIQSEGGQVRSNSTVLLPPNVGDLSDNHSAQAFFSFDISSIPSGATITKVVVNFSSFDMLGNPWGVGDDGCVRGYAVDYGALDSSDFVGGSPTGAVLRWCSAAELQAPTVDNDVANAMQVRVTDGDPRFQLRLQFRDPLSDFDAVADMIRFGIVTLTVTYQN